MCYIAAPTRRVLSFTLGVCRTTHTSAPIVPNLAAGEKGQLEVFAHRLRTAIEHDFQPAYVPDSITELPPRRESRSSAAAPIAALLFPDFTPVKADIHYETALLRARRVVRKRKELELLQRASTPDSQDSTPSLQTEWLGQEVDPVPLEGPIALPEPVKIGPEEDFKGLFQFLRQNINPKDILSPEKQAVSDELASTMGLQPGKESKWNTPMVEFKRGVVYDDGRLDLCKMVVGPTHVDKLLDALEDNTVVTQFLLGNNVISTTGARRIAKFITDHPERIETWYIAGNHIRAPAFQLLADAMIKSSRITNVWLKRNPLKPDSIDNLVRLITQTPQLRTLNLETTELGDEGVARMMSEITGQDVPLRHLYLNSNGLGEKAARAVAGYLAHPACKLDSLYLASNPIGDDGAASIAEALKVNKSLLRLSVTSTGLSAKGVSALCTALSTHPRIISVAFASSETTRVHGQRYNYLTDDAIPAITSLMHNPTMRHLDLGRTAFSAEGLEEVKLAVVGTMLCKFHAFRKRDANHPLPTRQALEANIKRFFPEEESYETFVSGLNARFLYSPEDVRLIDSVYRTRDRRSDQEIEQVWKDGDPVWQLVDGDV